MSAISDTSGNIVQMVSAHEIDVYIKNQLYVHETMPKITAHECIRKGKQNEPGYFKGWYTQNTQKKAFMLNKNGLF